MLSAIVVHMVKQGPQSKQLILFLLLCNKLNHCLAYCCKPLTLFCQIIQAHLYMIRDKEKNDVLVVSIAAFIKKKLFAH